MRLVLSTVLAAVLAGCATAPQHPTMRPLTPEHIETMGPTRVVVSENNMGIEKSWFYTSTASAGAAYGLIGALVTVAMDAIINAGPSRRARKAADEMEEVFPVEALNASLTTQMVSQTPAAQAEAAARAAAAEAEARAAAAAAEAQAASLGAVGADASSVVVNETVSEPAAPTPAPLIEPTGVWYEAVEQAQRLGLEQALDDAIELDVRYTLSEDSSTLRVVAAATYQSAATPYSTRYAFEGSPPRNEREGPAYRNTFTYYSSQLPVPTLTPELQARLISSVEDSARDDAGALPAEGTDEYRALQNELENARDDRLSKDEIAIFLTREWIRDDGARLRREIEQAHAFIARYLLSDLNRTDVPTMTGQDELLETGDDDRTVRRIGAGTEAGSYVSSAGNLSSFSTYGNAIGIARVNRERMETLSDEARRSQ